MCSVNGANQCALGMGLAYVPWKWYYPMCPGNENSQCSLANVLYEWDYPMCPRNGASQCAQGMGLSNVPWEWE